MKTTDLAPFFRMSLDLLAIADLNGYFTELNPAWETALGWTLDELKERPFIDFVHPDDTEATVAEAQKLATGAPTIRFENRYLCRDGSYRWLLWSAAASLEEGLIYASARDIDERKRLEARLGGLASIVEGSEDAILSKDLQGVILSWNSGAEQLYGYTSDEVIGQSISILLPPDRKEEVEGILERVTAGDRVEHFDTKRVAKSGQLVDVSLAVSPIRDRHGRVVGASSVARDISLQKKAQQALKESERRFAEAYGRERLVVERLQELDELKNEFVGIVAHDLRSPMTVITGYAGILEERWEDLSKEQIETFLAAIGRTVKSVGILIEDVLQVARIESGELNYRITMFDLSAVVQRTVDEMLIADSTRRCQVSVSDKPVMVIADEQRQWQVLSNLLGNAFKFSDEGEQVEVVVEGNAREAMVSVKDQGMGIALGDIGKIFEKFSRVEQSEHKPRVKGTGLGLYIVKRLVEGQGGKVSVVSEPGKGSTFTYTVPAANTKGDA